MDMQIVYYTIAVLLVLLGLVGTVLPAIPGLPLMFAGMLLGAWAGQFAHIGVFTLVVLGLLTLLSLIMDFWVTAMGAKRVGASKRAIIGASIGTFAGLLFGIWGLFLGPFAGAAIGELQHQWHVRQAAKVGLGTWLGLLFGVVLKLALAFTMLATFAIAWFL
ncbi:MAG: DUF456 domain-containing protein [Desulfobulbaceae bacterium]|nr:DUF456 domain-containing protein [Desulfobulbaceae bacterium]